MSRIYLIIPYYGNFPNYFQLYLDSLSINKDILSIILITDIDTTNYNIPDNLILEYLSLNDIKKRASTFFINEYRKIVEPDEIILHHYKLCDFRCVYTILFEDIIQKNKVSSNDLVGWGDIDVIYGKLSSMIDLTKNYDVIGHHGHFTAIKNTSLFTNLSLKIDNLLELLKDNKTYAIDEVQFRHLLFNLLRTDKYKVFNMCQKFCDIIPPQYANNEFKMNNNLLIKNIFFDKQNEKLVVNFENDTELEVSYCHLQKRKMEINFTEYNNGFYILKDSFKNNI